MDYDIRSRIVECSLAFRDASKDVPSKIEEVKKKNLAEAKEQVEIENCFKLGQEECTRLFALLDELDVIEGRGIQR
jgi:hypothetical protein